MNRNYLFILLFVLFTACSKDVLDRTIFIPDEDDSNLPAYTEWGYNTFGAEYDRDYFLVSQKIVPCKIVYKSDSLQFLLSGIHIASNYYAPNYKTEMSLFFVFPVEKMRDYRDLLQLHKKEIDLATDCIVKMTVNKQETILTISKGKLHFKRAQLLSVDDKENRVILSGTFDLIFLENGWPVSISDGRFDLGITEKVFYAF